MQVSFNSYNYASFGAKNQNIRKADKIMRASGNAFPAVSSTYIDTFYRSKKAKEEGKIKKVSDKVWENIDDIRTLQDKYVARGIFLTDEDRSMMFAPILRGLSELKCGNCYEKAVAAVGALAANGIRDAEIFNLYVDTRYYSKKDGSLLYSARDSLDHCCVLTAMGANPKDIKNIIVIDPWLSFCDSASAAVGKYKQIFSDEVMYKAYRKHRSLFRLQKFQKGETFNEEDYILSQKIDLNSRRLFSKNFMEKFGDYCLRNFPALKAK